MTPDNHQTPYVIYDAQIIDRQHSALRQYLDHAYPRSRIYYALKACYLLPVVNRLVKLGCGLEVATPSEHAIARYLHLAGPQIFWNGPSLRQETLRGIVERGELLGLDSPHLFQVLNDMAGSFAKKVPVCLRINLSADGRLGMSPDQAEFLLKSDSPLEISGFHMHIGRGDQAGTVIVEQKLRFLDLILRWESQFGLNVRHVNLGGGIPVGRPLESSLGPLLNALSRLKSAPELFLEPGAFLVEEAATAYARVVSIKTLPSGVWAALDLGANFLVPLNRAAFAVHHDQREATGSVTHFGGPFCFEADVIARNQPVAVQPGDVVRITRCGAYTESLSSCFFTAPPPAFWLDEGVLMEVKRFSDPLNFFLAHHGYPSTAG